MRDVYEVLREKERAIERVSREIRLLRLAAPLLTEDTDIGHAMASNPEEVRRAARQARADVIDALRSEADDEGMSRAAKRISARLKRLATPLLNASRVAS